MKSIVLPAGTEHVQFGELAHLIADALWPDAGPDDDSMTNAFARINLDAELARAVDSGALPVKDPLTLGPHTYPVGYALKTALVTVDDLQRFVSDRGLSVIVETPEPQAADAPAAKGEAVPVRSPSGDDIPGKMPQTNIGKLAIKAAWQIECSTGKQATAKQVIEKLQAWTETEPELTEIIPHGVKWATTKGRQKPFDVEACAKALGTDRKSVV